MLTWVVALLLGCGFVAIGGVAENAPPAGTSVAAAGGRAPAIPTEAVDTTTPTTVGSSSVPEVPAPPAVTVPRRRPPTVRPPTVHPPTPTIPDAPPPTVPDPELPPPPTTVDRCAALRSPGVFAPVGRGLFVVDAVTSTAVTLAAGYSIGGASWSPTGDRVVFSGRQSGGTHGAEPTTLWIARSDGTSLERVAADAAYPGGPSWSPDGTRIAYYSTPVDSNGHQGLYLLDVASGESRLLARVDQGGFAMEWSPDGKRIALPAPNDDAVTIVEVADGTVENLPVTASAYGVSWSPTGDRLLVSDLEGPVRVVRVEDGTAEVAVADGRYARWSPRDERISVWRGFDAHVFDLRTGEDRVLATNADPIGWSRQGDLVSLLIGTRRIDVVDATTSCTRTVAVASDTGLSAAAWSPTAASLLVVVEASAARRY